MLLLLLKLFDKLTVEGQTPTIVKQPTTINLTNNYVNMMSRDIKSDKYTICQIEND